MPFLAADVALLPGRDQREEPLVPDLVVRVVDRDPVVLEPLGVGLGQRLGDDLADPAAGEALFDRLGVAPVEVRLREPVHRARNGAAGERVRVRVPLVVAVDQLERLEHVLDRLHAGVRPAGLAVLAPVVVDVAEAALLLRAEVLAEPQHGQVDQVAPLDRRCGLHHALAIRERVAVVLGHRRQAYVRQLAALQGEPELAVDPVGRARVDPHGDDRPVQLVGPARERDLLRRPLQRRCAELRERLLVEREDEVRLRLDRPVEVVRQRVVVERDPGPEQVLLQHRLRRDLRIALDQLLDEPGARADGCAHGWNLSSFAAKPLTPSV